MTESQRIAEYLKGFEKDHAPNGWPAIRMATISEAADHILKQEQEIEQLKFELAAVTGLVSKQEDKDAALRVALEAIELHLQHHEHGCVYLSPAIEAIKEVL